MTREHGPGAGELIAMVRSLGLPHPERTGELLWRFHLLLRRADAELNLTRLRSFGAMLEKHYIDSLLPLRYWKPSGRIMDLGSGGGFPGMPLAIALPEVQFVLVEGRRKRTAFLADAARELGLENVEVVSRKLNPLDRIAVDHGVVRAVARSEDLLDRMARSVAVGGTVALMKGPDCDDEVAAVAQMGLPFALADDVRYALPRSKDARRLLVFRREDGEWPLDATAGRGLVVPAGARRIESEGNATYKRWKQLLTGRGSRKHGETLLAGERFVTEVVESSAERVLGVLSREGAPIPALPESVQAFVLGGELFSAIDQERTGGPIAWLAIPELPEWQPNETRGVALLLAMQNPDNVGAAIRSAEAFGASEVVLLDGAASPYQPKALRAAGPSAFRVALRRGPALEALAEVEVPLVGLDAHGEPIGQVAVPNAVGLVIGREGTGLAGLDASVPRAAIPMQGPTESLNAAVAAAVALYAITSRS